MHLHHLVRAVARLLVQFIHVLRDQRVQLAARLQRDQRPVAGVRARRPRRMLEAALPGTPVDKAPARAHAIAEESL